MTGPLTRDQLNDPVTRHLRSDFPQLAQGQTVGEALAAIRARPPAERVVYFYVVDDEGRLRGVVPTRRLLFSPLERPLAEVMVTPVVALPATATVLDACELFIMHRLLALPVVDGDRRLLGMVDVSLYTAEVGNLEERARGDDLFQLVGVHLTEAQQGSPTASFVRRFPWLLCNVGGGLVAAFLAWAYEAQLRRAVELALFIPVVLALAESVSIQSVSLALQTLHGRRPSWSAVLPKVGREAATGLLLGGATGLTVAGAALVWLGLPWVALCVLLAIVGGVAGAASVGLAMPYLLRLLRLDPQVAAGPVALAAADMMALLLYFNLARWLLP
jgi:magnesium transporter